MKLRLRASLAGSHSRLFPDCPASTYDMDASLAWKPTAAPWWMRFAGFQWGQKLWLRIPVKLRHYLHDRWFPCGYEHSDYLAFD